MNLEIRFTLPNQGPQTIPVKNRILIGTLMSNEVVIRAPGVEPIHAMIEVLDDGTEILTDLGSQTGVNVNGKQIEVESRLKVGDVITIGDVKIDVLAFGASSSENFHTATTRMPTQSEGSNSIQDDPQENVGSTIPPKSNINTKTEVSPESPLASEDKPSKQQPTNPSSVGETVRRPPKADRKSAILFSPRAAKPSGDVLEVVSYWGDTVLDVDLFHPQDKDFQKATIGTPPHAHFLAGGKSYIKSHLLAHVSSKGYKIRMLQDMQARVRKGGEVLEIKGKESISLGRRDIAHIAHGPVKYFLMFVKPPEVILPKSRNKDGMSKAAIFAAALFYFILATAIYFSPGATEEDQQDDIWSIVNVPEKKEPPKPDLPKPKQEIAKVKPPETKPRPPKPVPKPPKPVPPKEAPKPPKVVEKVKQPKPVEKPTKQIENKKKPVQAVKPKPQPKQAMVSTGAKKPDRKLPGKVVKNRKLGLSGGPKGGGRVNPKGGGQRKGTSKSDVKGVEGVKNKKASGVNLGKLGLGAGLVLNKKGAGAIKTKFNSSAGGAGGGSGSGSKTYGMGGPGKGSTLAVSGTDGAANNFGGFGGNGSGAGGSGGIGGAGITKGFARKGGASRANVSVPASDPVISGGLSQQEVQRVIRANLNQIRHCYESLLQRSPSAQGKIKVKFVVNPGGRVGSASIVSSSISDSVMRGCVTGKVKRWKFPAPRGGKPVTVNYPFVFNPL